VSGRSPLSDLADVLRGRATDAIELELAELEGVFALLVVGSLSGLPLPPSSLGLRLLPHVEAEVVAMLSRAESLDDMMAVLAGRLSP
jgi:hypothetical protein